MYNATYYIFVFKQKTAYEMRISDWSSDVCSSDLPTYLIRTAVGRYVMRKKPAGELLASAHRIDREYRIMAALHGVIPVPRMLHLCLDETVIGQAFYLMDHVEGRIAADARDRKSTRLNSSH